MAPVYTVVGSHTVHGVGGGGAALGARLVMGGVLRGGPWPGGTGPGGGDVTPSTSIGRGQPPTTAERTLWPLLTGELHGGGGGEHRVLLQQVALGGLLGGVVTMLLQTPEK